MIESLPKDYEDHPDDWMLSRKINEIIEAVNAHDRLLMWAQDHEILPILGTKGDPLKRPSGLRPLHIEDGQVKEAIPSGLAASARAIRDLMKRTAELETQSSVPEAEPPEQEPIGWEYAKYIAGDGPPLGKAAEEQTCSPKFRRAIDAFEQAAIELRDPRLTRKEYLSVKLDLARTDLIAAAHREYAQPHVKDGEDATLAVWAEGSRPAQPEHAPAFEDALRSYDKALCYHNSCQNATTRETVRVAKGVLIAAAHQEYGSSGKDV